MNIKELLENEHFLKTDQFHRRKTLNKYILTEKDCKIGTKVICFEDEVIINEKNKIFYKPNGRAKLISTVSIGRIYTILDFKDDKIKIENNLNKKLWYTMDRFLFSLKIERKEKLEKIKNSIYDKD